MLFSASQGISQGKSIKDVQLDSLIWNKINEYLVSLDKTPIKHFEGNEKLGTASVTTSWHAIFDPNFWPTQSGYYFQVKNENQKK